MLPYGMGEQNYIYIYFATFEFESLNLSRRNIEPFRDWVVHMRRQEVFFLKKTGSPEGSTGTEGFLESAGKLV